MSQQRAARSRRRTPSTDDETLDPEQAEALSKAAREAVRQPPDPRIEKSFAHLGLVADPEPEARPKRTRTRRSTAAAAAADTAPTSAAAPDMVAAPVAVAPPAPVLPPPVDLGPLTDALTAMTATAGDIRRRLELVTYLLGTAIVLLGALAVILLVRP